MTSKNNKSHPIGMDILLSSLRNLKIQDIANRISNKKAKTLLAELYTVEQYRENEIRIHRSIYYDNKLEELVDRLKLVLFVIKNLETRAKFLKNFIIILKQKLIIDQHNLDAVINPTYKKEMKIISDFIQYMELELQKHSGKVKPRGKFVFSKEGDFWIINFKDKKTLIKHMLGLTDIHSMLKSPDKSILENQDISYDPIIDRKAIHNLDKEKNELKARIEENKKLGYSTEKLEEALEKIDEYLNKSVGRKGRPRKFPTGRSKEVDRLRKRVNLAVNKIEKDIPDLADYLNEFINLSTLTYTPQSYNPIPWEL
jgi:hypothetical protein